MVHHVAAATRELRDHSGRDRTSPALGSQASRAARRAMIAARPAVATNRTLLGVVIFIASESIFFLAIVLAYVAYREAGLATARRRWTLAGPRSFPSRSLEAARR